MIGWMQWNLKMLISMMTIIIDLGRNMKWTMTLNLCLVPLNKISKIKYKYGSLNQPMAQNILWRLTILFISQIMGNIGGLFRAKGI